MSISGCLSLLRLLLKKHHSLGVLNNRHLFITVLEAAKPQINMPEDSVPHKNLLPGLQKAAFSPWTHRTLLLCLHMKPEMVGLPLLRRHQSHHGYLTFMSPSKPNSLQRPHLHIPTHNVGGGGQGRNIWIFLIFKNAFYRSRVSSECCVSF